MSESNFYSKSQPQKKFVFVLGLKAKLNSNPGPAQVVCLSCLS